MNTLQTPIDTTRCPLCGGENSCAMEIERATGQAQGACWCVSASFPSDLLARLPTAARDKACICATCLAAFNQQTNEAQGTQPC